MRPTFFGLEIARTGLVVSQTGLDITGHNIANVDTLGYTRQRIINTAYEPYSAVQKLRPVEQALVGGGAHIMIHDQIRSQYLDRQYRAESQLFNYWRKRTEGLESVEGVFEGADETTGLAAYMNYFFSAVNAAADESNDRQQRLIVKDAGEGLAMFINIMYDRLKTQQEGHSDAVKVATDEINVIAENIARMNKLIYTYEIDGQIANDLRDKRNLLLDQLSEIIDIDYDISTDNKLTVWLGDERRDDQVLVSHTFTRELECVVEKDAATGLEYYKPQWKTEDGKGIALNFNGGTLKASYDLAANSSSYDSAGNKINQGLPYFIDQLNTLVRVLVQTINEQHSKGYTHPASGASVTGVNFFWDGNGDISNVNAGNFRLSDDVKASEYNIACSTSPVLTPGDPGYDHNNTESGNNLNIRAIYDILNNPDIELTYADGSKVSIGSIFGMADGLVLEVATITRHSKTMDSNETIMMQSIDNSRLSVSGVSLDEEMVNMIKYQHAYSGASRVITTMDEALDILINRTGLVGR